MLQSNWENHEHHFQLLECYCYCGAIKKSVRHEKTKLHTRMLISLWFVACSHVLIFAEIGHNTRNIPENNISSVQGFPSSTVSSIWIICFINPEKPHKERGYLTFVFFFTLLNQEAILPVKQLTTLYVFNRQ